MYIDIVNMLISFYSNALNSARFSSNFLVIAIKSKQQNLRRTIMEAKDVLSLPWKKVTDWSELSESYKDSWYEKYFVCAEDVNVFIENVYRDIARKLNIPYEQLEPILKAENEAFYSLEEKLFKINSGYGRTNKRLIELQNTLRVPDTSNIEDTVTADNVSVCLKLFEGLSNIEKMVFLQKIGKINVKIEHFAVQAEESAVE